LSQGTKHDEYLGDDKEFLTQYCLSILNKQHKSSKSKNQNTEVIDKVDSTLNIQSNNTIVVQDLNHEDSDGGGFDRKDGGYKQENSQGNNQTKNQIFNQVADNDQENKESNHYGERQFLKLTSTDNVKVDFFIFGHRHLVLDIQLPENSRYINLGHWLENSHYGVFDGVSFNLIPVE